MRRNLERGGCGEADEGKGECPLAERAPKSCWKGCGLIERSPDGRREGVSADGKRPEERLGRVRGVRWWGGPEERPEGWEVPVAGRPAGAVGAGCGPADGPG